MAYISRQRRLKFIDTELRKRRFPSARALAKLFEGVSSKTLLRDIEFMRDELGARIAYDKRKKGFYYDGASVNIGAFQVNERDFFTLYIAQKILEQYRGTSLYPVLKQTLGKLEACIPGDRKLPYDRYTERIIIRSAPLADMKAEYAWDDLVNAVIHEKIVEFEHHSPFRDKDLPWRVHPLLLLCEEGRWYLVALTDKSPQPRHFALWRIRSLKVTREHFDRPAGFKAEAYLRHPVGSREDGQELRVLLRFSNHLADLLREREWFPGQQIQERKDGRLDLTFRTPQHFRLISWILNWGPDVEIVKPLKLRRELIAHVAAIRGVYD